MLPSSVCLFAQHGSGGKGRVEWKTSDLIRTERMSVRTPPNAANLILEQDRLSGAIRGSLLLQGLHQPSQTSLDISAGLWHPTWV